MSRSYLDRISVGRTFIIYFATLVAGVGLFWWMNAQGKLLMDTAAVAAGAAARATHPINHLLQTLLALAVVIVTARAVGALFKLVGQPVVIGEVVGGILLGPSFLGEHLPEVQAFLIPASTIPFLGVIAQLGVIFYMFVVGLDLDLKVIRKSGQATLLISHFSILAPFLLGALFALKTYRELSLPDVSFTNYALFLGVAMSVTAFPVLARILTDRKMHKSRMGNIALTCAAIDDVTAWCLLAIVVSLAQAKVGGAIITVSLTFAYILMMFFVGGPLVRRLVPWLEKFDRLTEGGVAFFFVGLLLSALATEAIGIHAIFGAFLLGAITPHDSRVAAELTNRIQDLVQILFLPAFFAFTGMRAQFGLLTSERDWLLCGILIAVATIGKFGGTFIASIISGLGWRDSAALGVLMNTRGLVELIVLNLGLDLRLITPRVFAMLVMMALVTTLTTAPVLHLLTRKNSWKE